MARGLRLTALVSAVIAAAIVAAPRTTHADEKKDAAKPGIDAKTAFARIKTLAGNWKSQTSMDSNTEHSKEKGEGHKAEESVTYKLTVRQRSCRNAVSRNGP